MTTNKIVLHNCERLGIKDIGTVQKAGAFLRVLSSKAPTNSISETAKIILCLDLAATIRGIGFDQAMALKLAGYRKGVYSNYLNNIKKLLNLDKVITITELCVQFGCSEAKETAQLILKSYYEQDCKIKDIEHPQYVAAAVFTSCKLNNIKVDKSQMKLVSRLKAAEWNDLLDEFNKFATFLGLAKSKKVSSKRNIGSDEDEILKHEDQLNAIDVNREKLDAIEDYEIWRERILQEASAAILQEEMTS